jgi:hypothetical protein
VVGAGGAILEPGEVFAEDFRIVRTTDTRGAAASYVVEQLSTGKQRLLRVMLPELVADEGRRARFEHEVRVGSRIEKKLSLDDKVAKYFPDLTRARDIALYDLMTHVSGYRDNYPLDFVDKEMSEPITPDESITRYGRLPLDFEPRTRFSYSSTGYKILGRVIEKVTAKPLAGSPFMQKEQRVAKATFAPHRGTVASLIPTPTQAPVPRPVRPFAAG